MGVLGWMGLGIAVVSGYLGVTQKRGLALLPFAIGLAMLVADITTR